MVIFPTAVPLGILYSVSAQGLCWSLLPCLKARIGSKFRHTVHTLLGGCICMRSWAFETDEATAGEAKSPRNCSNGTVAEILIDPDGGGC